MAKRIAIDGLRICERFYEQNNCGGRVLSAGRRRAIHHRHYETTEGVMDYLKRHRALVMESLLFSVGVASIFLCLHIASAGNRAVDNAPLVATHKILPR